MTIINNQLRQAITHWTAIKDRQGGYTFSEPSVLLGRWEEKNELYKRFGTTEDTTSSAVVYFEDKERVPLKVSDYLYLGESTDDKPPIGSYQINQVSRIPDLRNLRNLTKVWL